MKAARLVSFLATCLLTGIIASSASAQSAKISDGVVKIGVLTDLSGVYSDFSGNGSIVATQMAIDDFGGKVLGAPIELVSADHQNKADIGANIARQWYESGKVDVILDTTNSAVTLAVVGVTKEKNKIVIIGGSSTTRVTTSDCTPNSIQYIYDANALANVTGKALIKAGGKTWYFITVDFAFGHGLEKITSDVVKAAGGNVLGAVRHPLNTGDFSSYLLQAQNSGAQIIALANGGTDTINAIKAANEFGIMRSGKQKVASLLVFISDVHSMGLRQAQNIVLTETFYWDLNEETRAWSKRFFEKTKKMPSMVQAGMYSATMHYLKAIESAGTDATQQVMAKMKETRVNDFFVKNGEIRADGLHVHEMHLFQVKKPEESKYPWDYYKHLATVSADDAFSPMDTAACPFLSGK
jgi:branched-chain amino acid transport system substrate-binding protein